MKFRVSQRDFLQEVQKLVGIVPAKTPISIVENILFHLDGNLLSLTATDLDISIALQLDVDGETGGDRAIPARKLMELLRVLPEESLLVESSDGWGVVITTSKGKYRLPGQDPAQFPVLPQVEKIAELSVEAERMRRYIEHTTFTVARDTMRAVLTGVYFVVNPTSLTVVATDGHRLSKVVETRFSSGLENTSFIFPTSALTHFSKMLETVSGTVRMALAKGHVVLEFQRTTMFCRLVEGMYPPYDSVIPNENANVLEVEVKDLTIALRRVQILSNTVTHQVLLQLAGEELRLVAEDSEFGSQAEEKLPVEYRGEPLNLAFNSVFFQEILKHIPTEKALIKFGDAKKPALFFPKGEDDQLSILYLLMPIRTI